jgi:hypothetical protein
MGDDGLSQPVVEFTQYTLAPHPELYTTQLCHQLCQEDVKCQFFAISTAGKCNLYRHGACTKSADAVPNTNLYAKQNFYENPF